MQASFRDPRIPEARSPRRTLLETVRKSDSSNAPTVDLATIRRPNGPKGSVFHMPARLRCRHLRAFSDGFSRHLGESRVQQRERAEHRSLGPQLPYRLLRERAWQSISLREGLSTRGCV